MGLRGQNQDEEIAFSTFKTSLNCYDPAYSLIMFY